MIPCVKFCQCSWSMVPPKAVWISSSSQARMPSRNREHSNQALKAVSNMLLRICQSQAHRGILKCCLASCLSFWWNPAVVIRDVGLKKGFKATFKYSSWTSLKKLLTDSSLRPSCSRRKRTWAAVTKAETYKTLKVMASWKPKGLHGKVADWQIWWYATLEEIAEGKVPAPLNPISAKLGWMYCFALFLDLILLPVMSLTYYVADTGSSNIRWKTRNFWCFVFGMIQNS